MLDALASAFYLRFCRHNLCNTITYLECSGQNTNIFSRLGHVSGCTRKKYRNINFTFCILVSFRGYKKKLQPQPDWSPLRVQFRISKEHPAFFIWEFFPGSQLHSLRMDSFRLQRTLDFPGLSLLQNCLDFQGNINSAVSSPLMSLNGLRVKQT